MKLTINRDEWTAGWHVQDDKMCAIGHYLKAVTGTPVPPLVGVDDIDPAIAWLFHDEDGYSKEWHRITKANDRKDFRTVATLFAPHDVAVEFVGFTK
jgi:hypothetical protein